MAFSYKPLWKQLIDRDMTKKSLRESVGFSQSTLDKMGRNKIVSLEIIDKICDYFDCKIEDVIVFEKNAATNVGDGISSEKHGDFSGKQGAHNAKKFRRRSNFSRRRG